MKPSRSLYFTSIYDSETPFLGAGFNQLRNICQIRSFPQEGRGKNKTYLKPPCTSCTFCWLILKKIASTLQENVRGNRLPIFFSPPNLLRKLDERWTPFALGCLSASWPCPARFRIPYLGFALRSLEKTNNIFRIFLKWWFNSDLPY